MIYYEVYCKKIDSTIALGQSAEIVNQYISQFQLQNEVNVFIRKLPNGLETSKLSILELEYVTPQIVLTKIEKDYYNDYLHKLYDDMKTTISGLILYSNMGNVSSQDKTDLRQMSKKLYNTFSNYEDFIDSLDRDVLFSKVILNPITMQNVLYAHFDLKNRYRHLCSTD